MRPRPPIARALAILAWLLVLFAAVGACSREASTAADHGDEPLRLVSLSPALSRTIIDLGLGEGLVGRSSYCTFLDPAMPVIGDLQRIDYERLIDVAPTHVLVQAPAAGVDERLLQLAGTHGWTVVAWRGIDTIDDIERVVLDLPGRLFGPGSSRLETTSARAAQLVNEMARVLTPADGGGALYAGPTLLVHRTDPVSVFGTDTYLHEVLVRLGATNATTTRGWATLSLEDVARLDPGAIVLVRDGAEEDDAGDATDVTARLGPLADLRIDAVTRGRVGVLQHPDALLPCTGVIGVAESMREVLRDLARREPDE